MEDSYISSTSKASNDEIQEGVKRDTPPTPICGCGGRKEIENETEKSIRRKQGDTSSKGVLAAHGPFIISSFHCLYTYISFVGDTEANKLKEHDRSPSLEVTDKLMAFKGEYNNFNITPFHPCILCTEISHHITISISEHGCVYMHYFTISVSP